MIESITMNDMDRIVPGADWNVLHVLHVLLQERSVVRAAERLHVTSPAVSNALARLRVQLDDPLFVRSGRGLAPTPRALGMAAALSAGFRQLDSALHDTFDAATCTRSFVLALSDAEQMASLAPLVGELTRRLPASKLHVVSLDALVAQGGLARSDIEATIGPKLDDEHELHRTRLFTERAAFVVRRDHPRVHDCLDRALFESERHVDLHLLLGKAGSGHRAAEEAFARSGLSRRTVACTVPSFAALASVVAATDYVGAMPRRVAQLLCQAMPLRMVKTPWPSMRFEMYLYWHTRTHQDPASRAFRDAVLRALRERKR